MASIGLVLSPLTWWNDMVVNVPLAYLIALPLSMLNEKLFLPGFVAGYWFTNLTGLVMLHWGAAGLMEKRYASLGIKKSLIISVAYSGVIILMVRLGWLTSPSL